MSNLDSNSDLVSWIRTRSYWEQLLWEKAISGTLDAKGSLEEVYERLKEEAGLKAATPRTAIKLPAPAASKDGELPKTSIIRIKNLSNINAISPEALIEFDHGLTVIYGANGSGKSGYTRLLGQACFTRGDSVVLPNQRKPPKSAAKASATFVLSTRPPDGKEVLLDYAEGNEISELSHFAVFDAKSARVHVDSRIGITFRPAQIEIFATITEALSSIEQMLWSEAASRKIPNPFEAVFVGESSISRFCMGISSLTKSQELDSVLQFTEEHAEQHKAVTTKLKRLRKLDVTAKKKELRNALQELGTLRTTLANTVATVKQYPPKTIQTVIQDLREKTRIASALGAEQFDDKLFKTIGSEEWKALLIAARELFLAEQNAAGEESDLTHCILCHQKLTPDASSLFKKYWKYLEGKAQADLLEAKERIKSIQAELKDAKIPPLDDDAVGARILLDRKPTTLTSLRVTTKSLSQKIAKMQKALKELAPFSDEGELPDLVAIKDEIDLLTKEQSELVDPTAEIATLEKEERELIHRQKSASLAKKARQYLESLKWIAIAGRTTLPKKAVTEKQREVFDSLVTKLYISRFKEECKALDCNFGVKVRTHGERGNTVKELVLDFNTSSKPSQILSEGEQRVCALADFFSEIDLDDSNCGVIVDDPVTSLDQERKEKIAERLVAESKHRQTIVFTHDKVFLSYMVDAAEKQKIPLVNHWMLRDRDGNPGKVSLNTRPGLSSLAGLRKDIEAALKIAVAASDREQERLLEECFGLLRSSCEALIIESIFNNTVKRHDDYVRVHNLYEVAWDQKLAYKIVDLNERLSRFIPAHNRSDVMREKELTVDLFKEHRTEFEALASECTTLRKEARKVREAAGK